MVEKDLKRNRLVVEQGADAPGLFSNCALCSEPSWIAGRAPVEEGAPLRCRVRLRHRQPLQDCTLILEDAGVRIAFDRPQRAVTPGQSAVFYDGDICLGGAIVDLGGVDYDGCNA